jgi:hypothetical protein
MVEKKKAMRFKGSLILLCISLAVSAFYLFYLLPAEKEKKLKEELSGRFFQVDTGQIEFLRIQNRNGTYNLTREQDEWKITLPESLPADRDSINKIMRLMNEGKIIKIISHGANRLSEFELERPRAVLFIGYEGRMDKLALGGLNPAGTGIYAFAKGINAIFVVDKEIAALSGFTLYDLRSKAVFDIDPEAVTQIRIIKKDSEIELRKNGTAWQMAAPISGRASHDEVHDFLLGVMNQRADEFYNDRVPDAGEFSDTITLKLTGDSNSAYSINVHYWGTGADQGTVAYQNGMKYSGRLPREFWNFINREASSFRYRNIFDFDEKDVWRITIRKKDLKYELVRKGSDWYMPTGLADRKEVTELIWLLKSWKADKLLGSEVTFSREKPEGVVTLGDKNGHVSGKLEVYERIKGEVVGYAGDEEHFLYYAVSSNLEDISAVSSLDFQKIPDEKDLVK